MNYFVDSVLGLTINEIAITNIDNTLSKTVETHAVLTENMVINSLNSDETTLPLSAAQGKALDSKISGSAPYIVDFSNVSGEFTSEEIDAAIGGWDNLVAAINNSRVIIYKVNSNYLIISTASVVESRIILSLITPAITSISSDVTVQTVQIVNVDGVLSIENVSDEILAKNSKLNDLNTTDKTIVGAINEILPKANGVGKIDPDSDGTGEVFNDYTNNKATGNCSHAEGYSTEATGVRAHAEGDRTTASGRGAHAEGQQTTAFGDSAHAEGRSTTASGNYSHAEGFYTTASDSSAHAEGYITEALASSAHAEGRNTIASSNAAHAEGKFNFDDPDAIHMVGIGTSNLVRKNAIVIHSDGSIYINGIGGYQGTTTSGAQSLQEVIASLLS